MSHHYPGQNMGKTRQNEKVKHHAERDLDWQVEIQLQIRDTA